MAAMKMDSTTKSVAELESIVQLLKDELREKDLLGQLDHRLQQTLATLAPDKTTAAYAAQLRRRIDTSLGELECENGDTDDYAGAMAETVPSLELLATLPQSEMKTFKLAWLICEERVAPDLDRKGAGGSGDSQGRYKKLDNAFALAIANLYRMDALSRPEVLAEQIIAERRRRAQYGLGGFCTRSLQLLKEIWIRRAAYVVVEKALQESPLPPEVIKMIGDFLIQQHGIPSAHDEFLRVWTVARPTWERPYERPSTGPGPRSVWRRGCGKTTCPTKTTVKWIPLAHQWRYVHHRSSVGEGCGQAYFPRAACPFHHDEDLQEQDLWRKVKSRGPPAVLEDSETE